MNRFPLTSGGLMHPFILLLLFIGNQAFALIHFQETFEDSTVKFFTIEVASPAYTLVNKSRAYVINLMEPGYARFKTEFPRKPALSFDISLLEWKTRIPKVTHGKVFFQMDIYDTTQKLAAVFPLFEAIISDTISGKPSVFFRSNLGDFVGGVEVKNGMVSEIRIYVQETKHDTIFLMCEVNGKGAGALRAISKNGNLGVLIFGPKTTRGPFESVKLALDNIISADSLAELQVNRGSPSFLASVEDTNSVRLKIGISSEDSLVYLEASRNIEGTPLVLRRSIGASFADNRLFDFPLSPGSYSMRLRALKKDGFLTPWSLPAEINITGVRSNLKKLNINDVTVSEEDGGQSITELIPGKWYVLTAYVTDVKRGFTLFYLHHVEFEEAGPYNKGAWFDRKLNYIFNFSFGIPPWPPWFYASSEEVRGRTVRVDGKRYLYIDDTDKFFRMDTLSNTMRVRFRLLDEAKPGEWRMNGYLEDGLTKERSFLFDKPFKVLSAGEIARIKRNRVKNKFLPVLLLFVVISVGFSGWHAYRKSKQRKAAEEKETLLVRLRRLGIVINNSNDKHSHIVRRAETFILENLEKDVSLSEVATHLNLSPTYTGKIFKEATGYTVVQFINTVKINRACELILENKMNMIDIGMSIGFPNPHYFRRLFKELTGKLPSEYRS